MDLIYVFSLYPLTGRYGSVYITNFYSIQFLRLYTALLIHSIKSKSNKKWQN